MPSLINLMRSRRRTKSSSGTPQILGYISVWSISILGLSLALIVFALAIVYSDLIQDLPPIREIQDWSSLGGGNFPSPAQVYDRSGEHLLATLLHPDGNEREWMQVGSALSPGLPDHLIDAVIADEDETFWDHHGVDVKRTLAGIVASLTGTEEHDLYRSIPQRLIYMSILPAEDFSRPLTTRYIRSAVLAQNLVEQYSKEQILEWYLNSVQFGRLTQGIDAASLVYFDKHASELSLGECTFLAALLDRPDLDPELDFAFLKERQGSILARMTNLGMITREEFHTALDEKVTFKKWVIGGALGLPVLAEKGMRDALGLELSQRPGLTLYTTIDPALQEQVECTSQVYLDRVSGSNILNSADLLEECPAASSLPPLRPSDLGVDHLVDQADTIVIDPQSGEIMALVGDVAWEHSPGEMTYPLLYLSAFTRGYSPGSMILDLPTQPRAGETNSISQSAGNGPVRMRNALVGSFRFAAERTLDLVGVDAYLQMIGQLGIRSGPTEAGDARNLIPASLLDLTYAYTAFANLGTMSGQITSPQFQSSPLSAMLISSIHDSSGARLYESPIAQQSIISTGLAYLIVDILSDSSTRGAIIGSENIYDFDQQVAVMPESDNDGDIESWTIGFTPSLVIGVRVGNSSGVELYRTSREIGAASLWRALMEYGLSTFNNPGWTQPTETIDLEVCEPSGLLPTEYCPRTVRELYLRGTEPSQHDSFYVPIKINVESGKLATIFTPIDLVEEQIFIILPPEAREWADLQGYAQPPSEYDAIRSDESGEGVAGIEFPSMFTYLTGSVRVRGTAAGEGFQYYRLQYGRGLNPTQWFVIGEDHFDPQRRGLLTTWETSALEGLYTLQLLVVDREGTLNSSYVQVTVDNQPPVVELDPLPELIDLEKAENIQLLPGVDDNLGIKEVEFLVNGRAVSSTSLPPFIGTIAIADPGDYEIVARAYDLAGNVGESEAQVLRVVQ